MRDETSPPPHAICLWLPLPQLYDEYAEICHRHGVRLNTRKDVSAAWRSAIARIFELSSPDTTPSWATQTPPTGAHPLVEHGPLLAYIGFPVAVYIAASLV
eukprot:CAMPEP_0181254954 /NCGR_PEP_ID=MMETSP1096-20121128/48884_1 /TAXON_ID=156174 ORGANISM="Chrysochromulina ericina, Strain CCMP281" /NCGR_SAMPLE_ID=MMETSP1096 /ASSEMBLY_ACC=CAM_ASM_000453 /LENGTH=100 /DNA_ID=CAMNT_0023353035 /DNA_START=100 /DNA_END=403 /DNA_ORIENTATION=+